MHSGGFELTRLTYTRLENNLIRHRGDYIQQYGSVQQYVQQYTWCAGAVS